MKNLILLLITLILLSYLSFINPDLSVRALSPTPALTTPSPATASPSAFPTDEKVQEIRDVVKEKVQEKIQEIKERIEKKAFVGILKELTDSTLTIETLTGEKMVSLDKDAVIIDAKRKEIKIKDLEIDQKVICMGVLNENNILTAKRIVVVAQPAKEPPTREVYLGNISQIDPKQSLFTLVSKSKNTSHVEVKVSKQTKTLVLKDFAELKVGDLLLVITSREKDGKTINALIIKLLL